MFTQKLTVSGSSLKLLRPGEQGIVSRLSSRNEAVMNQLKRLGIQPGSLISLEQRFPKFVVRVRGQRVVLNEPTINAIFVRLTDSTNQPRSLRRMT